MSNEWRYENRKEYHMRVKHYYENPEILHIGTLENRSYYIPHNLSGKEMRRMLNGEWKFRFYQHLDEVEDFCKEEVNLETFADLPVPSSW